MYALDATKRYITKIARNAQRCVARSLSELGVGPTECECLHLVRKNPGASQTFLSEQLNIDRAAVARMIANLEKKGLIRREPDENDKRANKVYITDAADDVLRSEHGGEAMFYEWLTADMDSAELERFASTLQTLALKARTERACQFENYMKWAQTHNETE